ncbi:MAG: hypothetical protein D6784_17230, partial [Chloroflexi bacterium]
MNPDEEKNESVEPTPDDDAPGPPSDLDEGPRPAPVDEVQKAILEAEQAGLPLDVDVDDLPEPLPDLDEGPRPAPVDEVQEALFEAIQEGAPTDVDLDALPEPEVKRPQKIIHFKTEPVTPVAAPAAPPSET